MGMLPDDCDVDAVQQPMQLIDGERDDIGRVRPHEAILGFQSLEE
ncbi:hypothetical protein CBM2633_P350019 [Cupriavidus taiwanensis]|uniref:Uncharacterized protein n=2 Tax=Cupriavidus TaxID=106589 RepID=A0A375DAZ2_9BURK|nr:hypothetical protein CBM2585_P350015 [Cupriavidus taiwanensis]SOZ40656.1 hypothetical protein CBM2605_P350017 [Cupriavidus neocaledonicus]SOY75995.1 hypothetical protein CBM2592_P380017 [Cupriavidus taiwanensis]SOY76786.1 hypothetical protein CBM2589_P350018 [Cupriavidus taiwanensis]SOY78033.1 hypothetical protein CBM2586_P360016 [Cupriavidus taiwanensis]